MKQLPAAFDLTAFGNQFERQMRRQKLWHFETELAVQELAFHFVLLPEEDVASMVSFVDAGDGIYWIA